jgi:cell division protein FtsL
MAARTAPARFPASGLRVIPGRSPARIGLRQLAWLLLAVAMFFSLIYSRIFLDRAAFQITTLEGQISEQQTRFDELRLEVAQLESPQRIYAEAVRMGMVLPEEGRTVYAPMPAATDDASGLEASDSTLLLATVGAR